MSDSFSARVASAGPLEVFPTVATEHVTEGSLVYLLPSKEQDNTQSSQETR